MQSQTGCTVQLRRCDNHVARVFRYCATLFFVFLLALPSLSKAQTGGQGALEGVVTDTEGAVIPHAAVTAINQASGVETSRPTTSAGAYQVSPLIPGVYTVTIGAKGFQTLRQENIQVNGLTITGFNAKLQVGGASETITVTEAPAQLQTTNAVLGDTVTQDVYQKLPFIMSSQQRDVTSMGTLAPGAQSGSRAPNFSGTGNYLSEMYLDGIPTTTINQQSDNRPVSNSIAVESIDQMQIQTNGGTAEYQGAGSLSFTTKSGGKDYHGSISDFIRNDFFDTWGFTQPYATKPAVINGVSTTVPAGKPVEKQNEISIEFGGHFPDTPWTHGLAKKLFFHGNWDEYHGRNAGTPWLATLPTTKMRAGDFTELGSDKYIYNPLTNKCASSTTCTRDAFLSNGSYNTIPSSYISSISQYEQSFLPSTSLSSTTLNYLASGNSGYDNHSLDFKIDYDLTPSQRLSYVYTRGSRHYIGFGATLPLPYTVGNNSNVLPINMILEHSWTLSASLVNQIKYGFTRQGGGAYAASAGGGYATKAGITGLPSGQASDNFPCSTFATSTYFASAQYEWTGCGASYETQLTVPNSFTLVDNLQWVKGKHLVTYGIQIQWLQDNVAIPYGHSAIYTQAWSPYDTAAFSGTSLSITGKTSATASGYSYASFLLGGVHTGGTGVPTYSSMGGRYRPISPYIQDDWKLTPNLTLNLGLRWDYYPLYREVADRWSFFNPNAINSLTNTAGQLEFAGFNGSGYSCNCHNPADTYYKNFGPRVGLAWSINSKTVLRAGYTLSYTHSGGTGGRVDAGTGASQLGFGSNIILPTAVTTGSTSGPSYWLNDSTAFTTAGKNNTNFGGPGYSIPTPLTPSASSLTLDMGNYVNSAGSYVTPAGAPGYVDPYLSGRSPEFEFFNIGFQRALNNAITLTVNYAGSEAHFVAGAPIAGKWSGYPEMKHVAALSSVYAADGTTHIMAAQANTANTAIAQAADSGLSIDSWFVAAGNKSTTPTIGRWLRPYPQYSAPPSSVWANIANLNYHSIQISLQQRKWKGVSYTLNYTYSKNIGDDDTVRASWAVPAEMSSNGKAMPGNNRADRDLTDTNIPQDLKIYGTGDLPFGKGHALGNSNPIVRSIVGGWSMSGIFTYRSGVPLLVTASTCNQYSVGTCMPDVVPGQKIRKNGSWGKGITGKNLASVRFLNSAAFNTPNTIASTTPLPSTATTTPVLYTKIGDMPRTGLARYGLSYPSVYNLNASVQRAFNLTTAGDKKFIFQADCFNVPNKMTVTSIGTSWSSQDESLSTNTFGKVTAVSGTRNFQFSGRITF